MQFEEIFEIILEWAQFGLGGRRRKKKTQKFPWIPKILEAFPKTFSLTKMKPTKRPAKEKMRQEKATEEGRKEFSKKKK